MDEQSTYIMADGDKFGVEHTNRLSKSLGRLLFDAKTSDLTVRVGEERIPAHRAILASSCDYFSALLYGEMKERGMNEIVLEDVPLGAFKLIMRYIYTGILRMPEDHSSNMMFMVLSLAHLYGFEELQSAISRYLEKVMTAQNAALIFEEARRYRLTDLEECTREFIDENAEEILQTEWFSQLPSAALETILSRDTLCAKEIDIFKAVERWISEQPDNKGASSILKTIRLPLISLIDLTNTVMDSGLINSDRLLEAIKEKTNGNFVSLGYRGYVEMGGNIAAPERGTEVLMAPGQSEKHVSGLNLPIGTWDDSARRKLFIGDKACIVLRFGKPYTINKISMDLDNPSSYYVEVSLYGKHWRKVVDYSMYQCHSDQYLFFEPRLVRYVRVVGRPLPSDPELDWLSIKNFQACFTQELFKVNDGIEIPERNVASPYMGARIRGNKGSLEDAFIVGTSQRDPGRKVFSTLLSDFPLVVEFKQPYLVDSLRILFWDGVRSSYSYFVEVSNDNIQWTRLGNFSSVPNDQWQFMEFKPSAVVFIKIDSFFGKTKDIRFVDIECPVVR